MSTITITTKPLHQDKLPKLDEWLRSVLWDSVLPDTTESSSQEIKPFEIHRLKAKLYMQDGSVKVVQGVREIFEILDAPQQSSSDEFEASFVRAGKVVLIGRNLQASHFQQSLSATLEKS